MGVSDPPRRSLVLGCLSIMFQVEQLGHVAACLMEFVNSSSMVNPWFETSSSTCRQHSFNILTTNFCPIDKTLTNY